MRKLTVTVMAPLVLYFLLARITNKVYAATNIAFNATVALHGDHFFEGGWGYTASADTIVDNVFFPRNTYWAQGPVWWISADGIESYITIDLGRTFRIESFVIQADDNDAYTLSYWDLDEKIWKVAWRLPNYDTYGGSFSKGMQTRPNPLNDKERYYLPSPIVTNALKFEGNVWDSDKYFAVSEIQAYGEPIPIQPTENCIEDDSGAIDIVGTQGSAGDIIQVPIKIQSAPNQIQSIGLELTYDPSVLEYKSFNPGDLATSFDMFDVNPLPSGKLKIAGFSAGSGISQGACGDLIHLNFSVIGGQDNACYPLQMGNLQDHIAGFSHSEGCFCNRCNGDLNNDEEITSADALIAFKCYLGSDSCPQCVDVNRDGQLTPLDALCIFQKFLGNPSCLD